MGLDRRILPVLLGNILEAYDFCLYGLLAVYFSKIFFPESSNSLFFSFVLFSIAYIARPLGSILWGHIADKYGRKPVLMSTLSLMAIPAIGMAVMPSYESIGIAASVIVIILRFMQGVAFGGEFPTAIVNTYELSPANKKGFYSSFSYTTFVVGYLVALLLMAFLTAFLSIEAMTHYGWRVLFGLSIVFIIVLGYIRYKLTETLEIKNRSKAPFIEAMKTDYKNIIKIVLYMAAPNALFFNFLFHNHILLSSSNSAEGLLFQSALILFAIIMIPLMGFISDRINQFNLLKISYFSVCVFAIPLYMLFISGNLLLMFLAYFVFGIFVCISIATFPVVIVSQANPACRVSTVGIGHSLAVIFGSFIPAINESVKILTQSDIAPAFVIVVSCFLSLILLFILKQKGEEIL